MDRAPISYVAAPTAPDADGVCQAQTTADAGNLTINGALASGGVATFGEQQRVSLYSTGDLGTLTFTIYGTSRFGRSISETISGPDAGTVKTAASFKTVTRVAVDGAVVTAVTVGNYHGMETAWVPLSVDSPLKAVSVELSTGAGLTYEVQYGVRSLVGSEADTAVLALADGTLTAKTVSAGVVTFIPYPVIRLKINSFASGTATLRVTETRA
jgi:hypothetical protein